MNTLDRGRVRVLVYRDKSDGVWYATALELNLTVDADDGSLAKLELERAINDYLASARDLNDAKLLNQEPDPELEALWKASIANEEPSAESPYQTYLAATQSLYA